MDLDALREALIEHGVDEALQKIRDSEQWEYSHAVEYAATCAAAAVADRAVLDSEEVWWCLEHDAPGGPRDGGPFDDRCYEWWICEVLGDECKGITECLMEPVVVVRVRLLAEEKL